MNGGMLLAQMNLSNIPVWLLPIWKIIAGAIGVGVLLVVFYFLLKLVLPKVAAIVLTTCKEGLSQPLFVVLLLIGVACLMAFPYLPYNTFGEDVKMLKSSGLTLIMILSVILGLWTASVSIADEIEGRTAVTLLSKPIRRWEFVIGKFIGILGPVAAMFLLLGVVFLTTVSYKVVFDAYEMQSPLPTSEECWVEMTRIVPGLFLYFFEAVVLVSISVAISTRLPMLANLMICASIYVLGHLVPLLVQSSVGRFEIVQFMGYLIATVLPGLDYFNVEAQVMKGSEIPMIYLAWVALYAALYSTAALLVALLLFQDRDLA